MKYRWAAFTVIELMIVAVVIGIISILAVVGYNAVQKQAAERSLQSDLHLVAALMQRDALKNGGEYPTAIPTDLKASPKSVLTVEESGQHLFYTGLTDVQNGVLLSQICAELIEEGVGQGVNSGGVTEDYITGCGNWNHDSMQITGWESEVYDTPVSRETLLEYGENFTTNNNNAWNKAAHEAVVENFYTQLVERLEGQGGSFPVESFWDSWATPRNGGVIYQNLPAASSVTNYYCVEARNIRYPTMIWHIDDSQKLSVGPC